MNHHGLLVGIIVENDNLQQPASSICANDEISSFAWSDPQRIADYMLDVFVADAVPSRAVRDLHSDKVALSMRVVKVALSTCGPPGPPGRSVCEPAARWPNDIGRRASVKPNRKRGAGVRG